MFVRVLALTALATAGALYAFVLFIDPYDSLWFPPGVARAPMAANARFAYPALARSARFDSIAVATSALRTMPPQALDEALGGRFANLAMNGATPYEQARLIGLFAQSHTQPRTVLIGMDIVWCHQLVAYDRFDHRYAFPEWLFDEDPWNDLPNLFSAGALDDAIGQARWLLGWAQPRRGLDGFDDMLPPEAYDLARARLHLYRGETPHVRPAVTPPAVPTAQDRAAWIFPDHALLTQSLAALPATVEKLLVFVPYHHFAQGEPGSIGAATWQACKQSAADAIAGIANAHVVDFMFRSPFTLRDENYVDGLHFRSSVGSHVAALIAAAVRKRDDVDDVVRYIAPTARTSGMSGQRRWLPRRTTLGSSRREAGLLFEPVAGEAERPAGGDRERAERAAGDGQRFTAVVAERHPDPSASL